MEGGLTTGHVGLLETHYRENAQQEIGEKSGENQPAGIHARNGPCRAQRYRCVPYTRALVLLQENVAIGFSEAAPKPGFPGPSACPR
jgi:hypothetical protein